MGIDIRNALARRAAQELKNGYVVNLGIGIPSLVSNHIAHNVNVIFHAENGLLGMGGTPEEGEEDAMLCNAGGLPTTINVGGSYFDSSLAFGMIRSGYIDTTILGALQVSEKGDLANWMIPGKRVPGIGGGMELAEKAKRVIVLMSHCNKNGEYKIKRECSLPLTAKRCVDLIITDRAVIEVTNDGLLLKEVMKPYSIADVIESTEPPLLLSNEILFIS